MRLLARIAMAASVLAAAAPGRAEELTPEAAREIERAMYLGRVEEAWRRLLAVRPDGDVPAAVAAVGDWRRWAGSPPLVETDPRARPAQVALPVVGALGAERRLRFERGASAVLAGSPLAGLPDPEGLHAAFLSLQGSIYAPTEEAASESRAHADGLRSAALRWAALAVAACIALAAALSLALTRRERRPTGTGRP